MMNIITSLPDTTSFDMETFWKRESIGIHQEPTETDERSFRKEYQEKNISFEDKHSCEATMDQRENFFTNKHEHCKKKRTESTIRRLCKDKHLLKRYGYSIAEQERRGFIEKVRKSRFLRDITTSHITG